MLLLPPLAALMLLLVVVLTLLVWRELAGPYLLPCSMFAALVLPLVVVVLTLPVY